MSVGGKAIGIPGELRGLWAAHQMGGRLPWRQVVLPAARLAKEGFIVGTHFADAIREIWERNYTDEFSVMK